MSPLRRAVFIADDLDRLEKILTSEQYRELETRLQEFVINSPRRVVRSRGRFQF